MRPGVFILLPVLLLVTSLAQAAEQWTEVKSPHFIVTTDAGDKRGREVALRFEQMREVFSTLFGGSEVHTPHPIQILAFKSTKGIRQVSPLFKGKVVELAGLYQKGQSQDYIALDLSSEGDYKWEIVFHEYAHLLLNSNTTEYPVWFDEGFAEFFSTIDFTGKQTLIGRAPIATAQMLLSNRPVPVAQLFAVQHNSAIYNESGDHRSMFYAESWLVVHYLYDKKLNSAVAKYFAATQGLPDPDEEQFRKYVGLNFAELDRALADYLRGNRITGYRVALPGNIDMSSFTSQPISDIDALVAIAEMHANELDHREQATEELKQALTAAPGNMKAQSDLGYAFLMKHDFANAAPYLDKAAAGGSSDPMVHYYYALLLQQEFQSTPATAAQLERQKKELDTALSLNPNLAEAYDLLGANARQRNDWNEAIASGKRAVDLDKRNDRYALNLAGYYLSQHRIADVQPLLARLRVSKDPLVQGQLASMQTYIQQVQDYEQKMAEAPGRRVTEDTDGVMMVPVPTPAVHNFAVKSASGTLVQIDCANAGRASLYLQIGAKLLQLRAPSLTDIAVAGAAGKLTCDTKQRQVVAEYGEDGVIHKLTFLK